MACTKANAAYQSTHRPPSTYTPSQWTRPDWWDFAACRTADPSLFYPEGDRPDWERGRRICAACPVRETCLADAFENHRGTGTGLRGGLTPGERDRARKTQTRLARRAV